MPSSSRSADVVVIGGGVIGLSSALELRRQGLRVSLIERKPIGRGGASWAGGGILAPLAPDGVDAETLPVLLESLAHYADWCAELQALSGIDPEYWDCGLRVLSPFDAAGWQSLAERCGLLMHHGEHALRPWLQFPEIAQVRSPRLLRSLSGAARALGVEVFEDERVLEVLGEPCVSAVRTDRQTHATGVVVLAAGAWSRALSQDAQVEPVRGQMLLLDAHPGQIEGIRLGQGMYLIPRRDGRVVAGSTLEFQGFQDQTTAEGRDQILSAVSRLAPELDGHEVLDHWSGLRPAPTHGTLRIGWAESRGGMLLNTGHHRLGITLAPGSARRAARLVMAGR